MNNYVIESFKEFEFQIRNKLVGEEGIIILNGKIPVILSAPHSVEQVRKGRIKPAETRTASIVRFLSENVSCYGAIKTRNFNDDANYDERNYFKDVLIEVIKTNNIKVLIDLHIMSASRKHNIDIGTGRGKNILYRYDLLNILISNFRLYNIEGVKVDYIFTASFKNTVSSTISRCCKIPCFQIEINWKLLNENYNKNKIIEILNSLSKSIKEIKELI